MPIARICFTEHEFEKPRRVGGRNGSKRVLEIFESGLGMSQYRPVRDDAYHIHWTTDRSALHLFLLLKVIYTSSNWKYKQRSIFFGFASPALSGLSAHTDTFVTVLIPN